jgi:hypothetical protein
LETSRRRETGRGRLRERLFFACFPELVDRDRGDNGRHDAHDDLKERIAPKARILPPLSPPTRH